MASQLGFSEFNKDQKPDIVFHLAATVGGISINQRNPGKFFYENAIMNLQVIHNAYISNVKKIINIGTVSVYPKNSPIPFLESNIWNGKKIVTDFNNTEIRSKKISQIWRIARTHLMTKGFIQKKEGLKINNNIEESFNKLN